MRQYRGRNDGSGLADALLLSSSTKSAGDPPARDVHTRPGTERVLRHNDPLRRNVRSAGRVSGETTARAQTPPNRPLPPHRGNSSTRVWFPRSTLKTLALPDTHRSCAARASPRAAVECAARRKWCRAQAPKTPCTFRSDKQPRDAASPQPRSVQDGGDSLSRGCRN